MKAEAFRSLSVPVHRASTVLFDSTAEFLDRRSRLFDGFSYGLYGTPTTRELEARIAEIEGGDRSILVPSGMAAIAHAILALVRAGDHVLVADCVYGPTRSFMQSVLAPLGIEASFFPADADSIASALRANTRLVVLESPGSFSMEIQEISAICDEAHPAGALVLIDNTWGFGASRMFQYGVDVVATALSKYASGHSDVCMGSITVADAALYRRLKSWVAQLGSGVSADDAYLVLRGLETLGVRLREHARRGLDLGGWLASQPEVASVINPAATDHPQHERFKRYFSSGNGLFSTLFQGTDLPALAAMIDGFQHFGIGASWGGTHSLVAIADLGQLRTATPTPPETYSVRFHVGLEPMDSLIADLRAGLARLRQGDARASPVREPPAPD